MEDEGSGDPVSPDNDGNGVPVASEKECKGELEGLDEEETESLKAREED